MPTRLDTARRRGTAGVQLSSMRQTDWQDGIIKLWFIDT